MNKLHIQILTPFGHYLDTDIDFLEVQTDEYLLGILPHHTPLISSLKISIMSFKNEGKETLFAIGGGVLNIKEDGVYLYLNSIEHADEIDIERAKRAKERAEQTLENKKELTQSDVLKAEAALYRALNRLNLVERVHSDN